MKPEHTPGEPTFGSFGRALSGWDKSLQEIPLHADRLVRAASTNICRESSNGNTTKIVIAVGGCPAHSSSSLHFSI